MKPHRIRMTHSLILNYGIYKKLDVLVRGFFKRFLVLMRKLIDYESDLPIRPFKK